MGGVVYGDSLRIVGHYVERNGIFARYATFGRLIGDIQLFGFLLGLPLAVIPYRNMSYQERAVTFSLTIALAIQVVFFALGVIKLTLG